MPESPSSYSVRCLFLWPTRADQRAENLYEERLTLWQASSFEEALELAEGEAEGYAEEGGYERLDFAQVYVLPEPVLAHGAEIFSLLRESDLGPDDYIDTFFATGGERQGGVEG